MRNKVGVLAVVLLSCALAAVAADTVLTWPSDAGKDATLRFTIGKLRAVNSYSGQTDYVGEATVENVGKKPLPFASFYLYLLDKNRKRIGEGYIEINNVGPGQQAKVAVSAHAMGTFAGMELQPQHVPSDEPAKVKMVVTSTPPGAGLKIDGQESGYTPQTVTLVAGKHELEVSKEGYATATTPVDVAAGALPAGVSLELSPLVQDTLVLRDGTVVLGDVSSVTIASVIMNVKGKVKKFDRNQVARIIFVQRQTVVKKISRKAR
jgi:hypothetical protein